MPKAKDYNPGKSVPLFKGDAAIAEHEGLKPHNTAKWEEPIVPADATPQTVGEQGNLTSKTVEKWPPNAPFSAPLKSSDFPSDQDFSARTGKEFDK